jgi:protein-S-isoprenylcysteine O-methyltransferase Ste14
MIGEISLFGLYVPTLLLLVVPALVVSRLLSRALARAGFYRFIWHPALFDFSLFVIVLGSLAFLASKWLS